MLLIICVLEPARRARVLARCASHLASSIVWGWKLRVALESMARRAILQSNQNFFLAFARRAGGLCAARTRRISKSVSTT
ncbi:hypothetical protein A2U01_0085647, partial [Trifolium medium]|nr:hypothetical protein [Trifolium medium]